MARMGVEITLVGQTGNSSRMSARFKRIAGFREKRSVHFVVQHAIRVSKRPFHFIEHHAVVAKRTRRGAIKL